MDLSSGPELDEKIALLIGYERLEDGPHGARWLYPNGGKYSGIPYFSTSIEAAWEVVERMSKKGWSFEFQYHEVNGELSARFTSIGERDGYQEWLGGLSHAPHAICLAALNAIRAL